MKSPDLSWRVIIGSFKCSATRGHEIVRSKHLRHDASLMLLSFVTMLLTIYDVLVISALLIRSGVETNPGPASPPNYTLKDGQKGGEPNLRNYFTPSRNLQRSPPPGSMTKRQRSNSSPEMQTDFIAHGQDQQEPSVVDTIKSLHQMMVQQSRSSEEIKRAISGLQKSIDNLKEWSQMIDRKFIDLESRILKLEDKSDNQHNPQVDFKYFVNKIDDLENRSRRNNIVISGLKELPSENWDQTESLVNDMLTSKLDIRDIPIERCHRVGRRSDKPRIIICKLLSFKDKQKIRNNCHKLKNTNIFVNDDFSARVRQCRRKLWAYGKTICVERSRFKLVFDKLHYNGKVFEYDIDRDEVKEVSSPRNNNSTTPMAGTSSLTADSDLADDSAQ